MANDLNQTIFPSSLLLSLPESPLTPLQYSVINLSAKRLGVSSKLSMRSRGTMIFSV